jgi:hypothetical protein
MSDGTFFVNSDGLDVGRNGFEQKGNQIQDLALRINDLMNPARVNDAAGNDSAGKTFSQQYLDSVTKLHDGMVSWGQVVNGTTDAINSMSNSFRRTDEVVTDAATQFGKSLLQLNTETGNVLRSDGSGGALTPDLPTVRPRQSESLGGTVGDPLTPAMPTVPPKGDHS